MYPSSQEYNPVKAEPNGGTRSYSSTVCVVTMEPAISRTVFGFWSKSPVQNEAAPGRALSVGEIGERHVLKP